MTRLISVELDEFTDLLSTLDDKAEQFALNNADRSDRGHYVATYFEDHCIPQFEPLKTKLEYAIRELSATIDASDRNEQDTVNELRGGLLRAQADVFFFAGINWEGENDGKAKKYFQRAVDEGFEQAVALSTSSDPRWQSTHASRHLILGKTYAKLNRRAEAEAAFLRAEELDSDGPTGMRALKARRDMNAQPAPAPASSGFRLGRAATSDPLVWTTEQTRWKDWHLPLSCCQTATSYLLKSIGRSTTFSAICRHQGWMMTATAGIPASLNRLGVATLEMTAYRVFETRRSSADLSLLCVVPGDSPWFGHVVVATRRDGVWQVFDPRHIRSQEHLNVAHDTVKALLAKAHRIWNVT